MVYAARVRAGATPPFAGPEAVLAYLSRHTHRVAISNNRLISLDDKGGVARRFAPFKWMDCGSVLCGRWRRA